jgi:hypothetical protein
VELQVMIVAQGDGMVVQFRLVFLDKPVSNAKHIFFGTNYNFIVPTPLIEERG